MMPSSELIILYSHDQVFVCPSVQRQYKLRSTTKLFTVPEIQSLTMEEHISLRRSSELRRLNEDGNFHDLVHV